MDIVAESIKAFVEEATGVGIVDMGIQIASTLLLFLVIRFFFWNNITDYLEKRHQLIQSELEEADNKKQEAEALQTRAHDELIEIRKSAKSVLDDAKHRGELEKEKIINNAKEKAQQVLENAQKEIDSEIEKARTDINNEIVNVAMLMAEKVIKKELDQSKHQELIDEITKEVQGS